MLKWLDDAVFYEIYPTSFYDSNGDGVGDLKGITEKVGYIKSLGVNAVWLNPIYKSPFKDGGYDIEDYLSIDKKFGTTEDLKELINAFHENGVRVVLDLVIGHTSNTHKWFKKSGAAKRNEYSDYYIWTNSNFEAYPEMIYGLTKRDGGYMKNYYASQPALNFGFNQTDEKYPWKLHYTDDRLKPLREEIKNIMRFYLDMGADGFRVDMAASLVKDGKKFDGEKAYEDTEKGVEGVRWLWNDILGTMRAEYSDKVYIAEWVVPQDSVAKCGFDMDFLTHDTFAFNTLSRNEKDTNLGEYYERGYNYFSSEGKGDLKEFAKYSEFIYEKLGDKGFFTAPTGTHDEIRISINKSQDVLKTAFALLLTIKQVPLVYYGDELGIEHNFNVSKDGGSLRTGARTPMLWTEEKGRGFSTKKTTYLPVSKQKNISVEAQEKDENSLLNTVRKLVKIRKEYPCFYASSAQKFIETGYPAVIERTDGKTTAVVLVNPSDNTYEREIAFDKNLAAVNCEFAGDKIILKPQSFAILIK